MSFCSYERGFAGPGVANQQSLAQCFLGDGFDCFLPVGCELLDKMPPHSSGISLFLSRKGERQSKDIRR